MKLPKQIVATNADTYIFALVCFFVRHAPVTMFSLGRSACDDREEPGFSPMSRKPDGRLGRSESAIGTIGFAVLGAGAAALHGMAWLWR